VTRWHNRVVAYAVVLATDRYLPFRLARALASTPGPRSAWPAMPPGGKCAI